MQRLRYCVVGALLLASFGVAELPREGIDLSCLSADDRETVEAAILQLQHRRQAERYAGLTLVELSEVKEVTNYSLKEKRYFWQSESGEEYETTHFLGAGEWSLRKGQYYFADISPMWVTVKSSGGQEIKFTRK